jgi:DNA-binding transcriptional ArsR family regulator
MSRRVATTDVFAAIADPTRRAILQQLTAGELPVMALANQFDVTLSAVSQHMRILREVGLVEARKAGRERVYRLNAEPLRTVADWTRRYEPFWRSKLDALGKYLDGAAEG